MNATAQRIHTLAETFQAYSYAELRANIAAALAGLTVAQLKTVAAELGWTLGERTKGGIVEEIIRRPIERKASWDRCQFTCGRPN